MSLPPRRRSIACHAPAFSSLVTADAGSRRWIHVFQVRTSRSEQDDLQTRPGSTLLPEQLSEKNNFPETPVAHRRFRPSGGGCTCTSYRAPRVFQIFRSEDSGKNGEGISPPQRGSDRSGAFPAASGSSERGQSTDGYACLGLGRRRLVAERLCPPGGDSPGRNPSDLPSGIRIELWPLLRFVFSTPRTPGYPSLRVAGARGMIARQSVISGNPFLHGWY